MYCTYMHTGAHMYAHRHMHTHTHMHVYVYEHTYTDIHRHTHVRVHTHAHTNSSSRSKHACLCSCFSTMSPATFCLMKLTPVCQALYRIRKREYDLEGAELPQWVVQSVLVLFGHLLLGQSWQGRAGL